MMQGAAYDPTFSTRKQPLGAIGATPAAGIAASFWRKRPGRAEFGFKDEFGSIWTFDNDEGWLNRMRVFPAVTAGATPPAGEGIAWSVANTPAMQAFSDANAKGRAKRSLMPTTTTAGTAGGGRSSSTVAVGWCRGSATGRGGFACSFIFGLTASAAGNRAFVGVRNSNAALAGDPSALTDLIGLGFDAGDAPGNWFAIQNDSSGTAIKTDTGLARDATTLIGLQLGSDPNGAGFDIRVLNLETMTEVFKATLNTDIPAPTTQLAPYIQAHNGANAAEAGIELVLVDGEQAYPYL